MIASGFNPMGVVIVDDDPATAIRYVENNPRICVAGGALGASCLSWYPQRMEFISRLTDRKAEIHALGFTPNGWDGRTCAKTVDSSSWKSARRFGTVNYWNSAERKLEGTAWSELTAETMPESLQQSLKYSNVNIEECLQDSRRINRGNASVTNTISTGAWYLRMIDAHKLHGQLLYLASSGSDLFEMIAVAKNFNRDGGVNYEAVRRERSFIQRECKLKSVNARRYIQKSLDNYWAVFNEY